MKKARALISAKFFNLFEIALPGMVAHKRLINKRREKADKEVGQPGPVDPKNRSTQWSTLKKVDPVVNPKNGQPVRSTHRKVNPVFKN